jgi:DNA-binding response OmpR family regulator
MEGKHVVKTVGVHIELTNAELALLAVFLRNVGEYVIRWPIASEFRDLICYLDNTSHDLCS